MRVTELYLSPAALACLRAADIADVDQLVTHCADELIQRGFGAAELYEVVCQLYMLGRTLTSLPGGNIDRTVRVRDGRAREMFRLRLVEGMTLDEIGERFGIKTERVRQIIGLHFGLRGSPPTVKARKWATTERRRTVRRARPARRRKAA